MGFKARIQQVIEEGVKRIQSEEEANESFRAEWSEKQREIRAVFDEVKDDLHRRFRYPSGRSGGQGSDQARLEVVASPDDVTGPRGLKGASSTEYELTFTAKPKSRTVECTTSPGDLLEDLLPALPGGGSGAAKPGDLDRETLEELVERFVKGIMTRLARQAIQ